MAAWQVRGLLADERGVAAQFDELFAGLVGLPESYSHPDVQLRAAAAASVPGFGDQLCFARPTEMKGPLPFDYQMLNLAWMFDLERRIALDDACAELKRRRGTGAVFDLECTDMLWRAHGFVHDSEHRLVPFPALLDTGSFRLYLRPRELAPASCRDTAAFAPTQAADDRAATVMPSQAVTIARKHNDWLPARTLGTRGGILADEVCQYMCCI
jgi:hypothetical protein